MPILPPTSSINIGFDKESKALLRETNRLLAKTVAVVKKVEKFTRSQKATRVRAGRANNT